VAVTGAWRAIIGQVTPPSPVAVSIRHRDGAISVDADELGRFRAERIPPGPVRPRLPAADQARAAW